MVVMYSFPLMRNYRYGLLLVLVLTCILIFYNYSAERKYPRYPMGRNPLSVSSTMQHSMPEVDIGPRRDFLSTSLDRDLDFNVNGNDVVVFLHIQKTGGTTFGKHLTRNLYLPTSPEPLCQCEKRQKRCKCYRPSSKHQLWLFSRMSTGWRCGLHADWTELQACVPDALDRIEKVPLRRRYFYITMVRNPLKRYLSEWKHTQRGATWKYAQHMCNGKPATPEEVPPCFQGSTWMGVSLKDYVACPSNWAHNRQTMMLADLTLVNCYNRTGISQKDVDRIVLESAKSNLESMAYFGLTEYQAESQYIFERTFKLRFGEELIQNNETIANTSPVDKSDLKLVNSRNLLDLELYSFAKDLFFQRYNHMKRQDRDYNFAIR